MSAKVAKLLEEHSRATDGNTRCAAPGCDHRYGPVASLPQLIAEHQAEVLAGASVGDTTDMRRMTMVEIRNRDFPDHMDAARAALLASRAADRADAELEMLRAGAAAGIEVIDGIYGDGGRRTIRLGELRRYAKEFAAGELDELLKYHHEDRILARRRELARASA